MYCTDLNDQNRVGKPEGTNLKLSLESKKDAHWHFPESDLWAAKIVSPLMSSGAGKRFGLKSNSRCDKSATSEEGIDPRTYVNGHAIKCEGCGRIFSAQGGFAPCEFEELHTVVASSLLGIGLEEAVIAGVLTSLILQSLLIRVAIHQGTVTPTIVTGPRLSGSVDNQVQPHEWAQKNSHIFICEKWGFGIKSSGQ